MITINDKIQVRKIQIGGEDLFVLTNLYIPIMIGKQMISLPQLEDTEYYTFDGWYYSNTDEPFDETALINLARSISINQID